MKKQILTICIFFLLSQITCETVNLFYNSKVPHKVPLKSEFKEWPLEKQYSSYISSFSNVKDPYAQSRTWAREIIEKYGRAVLPLLDKDLEDAICFNMDREPCDDRVGLISYLLSYMQDASLLKEEETIMYTRIYEKKIEDYVMKYRVIDGTVHSTIKCISFFQKITSPYVTPPEHLRGNSQELKEYYEKKLGITGVAVVKSGWD